MDVRRAAKGRFPGLAAWYCNLYLDRRDPVAYVGRSGGPTPRRSISWAAVSNLAVLANAARRAGLGTVHAGGLGWCYVGRAWRPEGAAPTEKEEMP
mgnify:CR=1 FL=1